MKKIIYIGNNLHSKNPTTLVLLATMLKTLNYEVEIYSHKKNKFLRLFDMCYGIVKNSTKIDCILIDTYSTYNFYFALITSQLARFFKIKYIPILHGGNLPSRLKKSAYVSKLIFKNAETNIAPSNYLFKIFKESGFKTTYFPNAIELENYSFKFRKNITPKLLWVRAFDKIYNPTMAIEVLVLVKNHYPKVSLCMVGSDKDGSLENVKKEAEKYGVQDAVEFTGILDKKTWIKKSEEFDVFINTTTVDNTPVSVLEAMALGLPVVSTNVGGIPYLIKNEVNGLLVENNNKIEMVNAIIKLLENPTEAQVISKNARALVEAYDVEIIKEQWNKLLSK